MAEISVLVIFILLLVLAALLGRKGRELNALKQRNAILESVADKEVTRLKELEKELESLRPEDSGEQPLPEVFRELVMKREVMVEAGLEPTPSALRQVLEEAASGKETLAALGDQDAVTLARETTRLTRENDNLRGQMTSLRQQARSGGRGLDHPPCWATPDGKAEYIFDVALTGKGLIVRDRDMPHRATERDELPLSGLVFDGELPPERFRDMTEPLFRWSNDHDCRFVVRVFDTTGSTQKAIYKRHMRVLEHHFYKYEELGESF